MTNQPPPPRRAISIGICRLAQEPWKYASKLSPSRRIAS